MTRRADRRREREERENERRGISAANLSRTRLGCRVNVEKIATRDERERENEEKRIERKKDCALLLHMQQHVLMPSAALAQPLSLPLLLSCSLVQSSRVRLWCSSWKRGGGGGSRSVVVRCCCCMKHRSLIFSFSFFPSPLLHSLASPLSSHHLQPSLSW